MVHKRRVRLGKDAKDRSGLEAKEEAEEEGEAPAKQAPNPGGGNSKVSEAEREAASQRAIEVIKKGLKENPEAQKDGLPYFPPTWSKEFKPILGGYRKFVEKSSAFVVKAGDIPSMYTIHLQDDKAAATIPNKAEWELKMANTWQTYMHNIKKDDRKPQDFVECARQLAFQSTGRMDGDSRRQKKRRKVAEGEKKKAAAEGSDDEEPQAKKAKAQDGPKKKKKKAAA